MLSTVLLAALDEKVRMMDKSKDIPKTVSVAHDALLQALRETDRKGNFKFDTPDWNKYPVGRDFFLQQIQSRPAGQAWKRNG